MRSTDERFMQAAIEQAHLAGDAGETPVGAVVVQDGKIIAVGRNLRETNQNATAHAEIMAIGEACSHLGRWRLHDCTLYVTLEPCPMCAGAILNARLMRVVFGAFDPKAGCFGSVIDMSKMGFNHCPRLAGGVREEECSRLLQDFFRALRELE